MFISIRRPVYSNQKPAYGKENLQISISCAGDEETLTDCDFSYNPYCPNYQQIECGSKLSLSKIYLQKRHRSIVPLFHKGNVSITFWCKSASIYFVSLIFRMSSMEVLRWLYERLWV